MNLEAFSRSLGRFAGSHLLSSTLAWFRRRAAKFDVTLYGADKLVLPAGDPPFLIVANHVAANRSEMWPLPRLPYFRQYYHSPDSFVFSHIVSREMDRELQTVALCGAPWLSPRPLRRWMQQRIGQPFARGQMEAWSGYIAVEKQPGVYQRRFLSAVQAAVQNRQPILIFPTAGPTGAIETSALGAGAAHISRKHGLPILPACIIGSESWRPGNQVTVAFGSAFSTDSMTKEEINARISENIQSLLAVYEPIHAARIAKLATEHAPNALA